MAAIIDDVPQSKLRNPLFNAIWATDASGNPTGLIGPDGSMQATLGSNVITVGNDGMYATLAEAISYINSLGAATETLHTGTYNHVAGASILQAVEDIPSTCVGKKLFLKHSTDSFLYPIEVTNTGTGIKEFKPVYPMYGRTNGVMDYSIVSPTRRNIVMMLPGDHSGTGACVTIPSFTSVIGFGKNVTCYEDSAQAASRGIVEIPATSAEVAIKGIGFSVNGANRGSCILLTDATTDVFTTGQRIEFEDLHIASTGASEDGIWKLSSSKNVVDMIKCKDIYGQGYFDTIALFNTMRTIVEDCEIVSTNSDAQVAQCVSISGNSLANSDHRINGNIFRARNDSTALSAATIGVKVSATTAGSTNTYVMVSNNQIQCSGELDALAIPTLESKTSGIVVDESSVAVGDLVIHSNNNIFDCSGARLNRAIHAGASGVVFSANDRNKDGTAITTATGGGGAVTVVL